MFSIPDGVTLHSKDKGEIVTKWFRLEMFQGARVWETEIA